MKTLSFLLAKMKFIDRPEQTHTSCCCQSDSIFDFKTPRMYLTESITLQYGLLAGKLKQTFLLVHG